MNKNQVLTVLGCGNMGQSIAIGLNNHGPNWKINTFTPSQVRAKTLAAKTKGHFYSKISEIPSFKITLIACKPQQFAELAKDLAPLVHSTDIICSVMAGIKIETLQKHLPSTKKFVRIMPNTASRIGKGVSLLYFSPDAFEEEEKKEISSIFSCSSKVYTLTSENHIDFLIPVIGSGPAYIFQLAKLYFEYMRNLPYDEKIKRSLVNDLFMGSSSLINESNEISLEELIKQVVSKGGTTQRGLDTLEDNNWNKIFLKALDETYQRALELNQD